MLLDAMGAPTNDETSRALGGFGFRNVGRNVEGGRQSARGAIARGCATGDGCFAQAWQAPRIQIAHEAECFSTIAEKHDDGIGRFATSNAARLAAAHSATARNFSRSTIPATITSGPR